VRKVKGSHFLILGFSCTNPWRVQGQVTDVEIQAKELVRIKQRINEILSVHTGQPIDRILEDTDRDFILTPDEAVQYVS